jgi:hypothetical protein
MVRNIQGLFLSFGDQQEQPFVQANADHSPWIKWQRMAVVSTGWRPMLMSSGREAGQMRPCISGIASQRPRDETA